MDSTELVQTLESLRERYGYDKQILSEYELSFLVALSHFPELDSSQIHFKYTKIKTTLNARPTVGSLLFRSRKKRKYIIRVNSNLEDSLVVLKDVPFNARVGLFAHELCHFADYTERSFFGVLGRMFSYASKRGKEKFEKEIDSMTIARGFGWQLYDWSYYVLNDSKGTAGYREFKRTVYLEPKEIQAIIERLNH